MRKHGKIIEKWNFEINRIKVVVPVRMFTPAYSDQKTSFVVDFEYGEHHFLKESPDISELRRLTETWLRDIVTFKYEAYFYVIYGGQVVRPRADDAGTIESELEWRTYHIGTTSSGQDIYRDCSRMLNNGDWVKGKPDIGATCKSHFNNWDEDVSVLIPATPENEAGLKMLADAFESLQERLQAFLDPDLIEHNFAKLLKGGISLLGGPQ